MNPTVLDEYPEMRLLGHTPLLAFLRKSHTIFHSGYTNCILINNLQIFQFLHVLSFVCVWGGSDWIAILTSMKWYSIVVLTYVSLIISDVKQPSLYLMVICVSLEKCPLNSSAYFFKLMFFFYHQVIGVPYTFQTVTPSHIYALQIFSPIL